jgi:hypothetical protein
VSAERLVASMAASACLASVGWVSITWWPTADCTAMTLIECAMTSCSSRAMRKRSSVTARRASSVCSFQPFGPGLEIRPPGTAAAQVPPGQPGHPDAELALDIGGEHGHPVRLKKDGHPDHDGRGE